MPRDADPAVRVAAPGRPAGTAPLPVAALLAADGQLTLAAGDPATTVTGVTLDSRSVLPGDLYAALPGAHVHGARFAAAARTAGAVALLTDPTGLDAATSTGLPVLVTDRPRERLGALSARVYGEPATRLLTIGITGTNGKTTTAHLVQAGLAAAGRSAGLIGTLGSRIGDEQLPGTRTTPEAPELQALLALMTQRGAEAVAMEVSSHALAQGRVDGVVYDVAVFTNLSQDHLDFHGTMADYYAAKASLFTAARARTAVVSLDDAWGERLAHTTRLPVVTTSIGGGRRADWTAFDVHARTDGSTFTARGPAGEQLVVRTQLPGEVNVANALQALVALVVAGVDAEVAAAGIAACRGVPGRAEPVQAGQDFAALVDYAHTPDAVRLVLAGLRPLTPGRLTVVLGAGGDRDAAKRPLMGRAAAQGADRVVLTTDNPRSEDPAAILDALVAGAREVDGADVVVEPDRAAAIALAVLGATAGDTVLVAGKGHEQGQEVAGVVHAFDDRAVLTAAVRAASGPAETGRVVRTRDAAGSGGQP